MRTHRPPTTCPVCSESLITLRLGCPACGTELSGHFDTCRYCRLSAADLEILEVFLRGRGNVRDVQAHLEVSYPTARARLIEVLDRLGLGEAPSTSRGRRGGCPAGSRAAAAASGPPAPGPAEILADLAAGRLDVATAEALLGEA